MEDIIDTEEVDKDTISPEEIDQQFSKKYTLLAETTVSLKKSYINKLHGTKSLKLAVSLSDNSIEVYELSNTSLNRVCRLSGHKKELSEVVFSPKEDYLLYSTGYDGVIKLWDTRTSGTCVQQYNDGEEVARQYECMDVSCNGQVLCAGSQLVEDDAYLVFWDQRNTKPLGGYWNSHTEDITQVKFHKTQTQTLASGSLDGLINIYNILEVTEDDALTYSLNVENSVERLSWLDDKLLSCITQSNDVQIWDAGSGDMVKSYTREKVAKSIKRSRVDDCYVVDAYAAAGAPALLAGSPALLAGSHALLAGSHGGAGDVLRSVVVSDKKLLPGADLAGNRQTVRCCWYHNDQDILATAGEAGLLTVWRGASSGRGPANKLVGPMKTLHVNRHKPY